MKNTIHCIPEIPADIKQGDRRIESDISEIYAIRTNLELFEEYLKNCETVELVVISEKNHQVIGTAQVADLSNLLCGKSHSQYVPILNDNGSRIGDIHVSMKFSSVQKNAKSPMKKSEMKILTKDSPLIESLSCSNREPKKSAFPYENDVPVAIKNAKQNENVYRSILKERRLDPVNAGIKSINGVNDKLVAQVVARAQRLRGAILKESRDENPLALSESSTDSFESDLSANNEANLYGYFLGKKMSHWEEKKALNALRTTSPTPSLIDLAAETIRTCREDKNPPIHTEDKIPMVKDNKVADSISVPEVLSPRPRETLPIDYVDSLRIAVESLTLSPAGYRRVRSSCLSRGDGIPLSVTYFVQYDSTFGNTKKFNRKIINQSKPVKLCSRKQVGQVIYFNHEAVYDLPKTYLRMDVPLKFKIFHRHLNQRTPTELGIGSIYVTDAARARSLSSTQRLIIVNKGIKIGELKVTVELGCDKIHFGKQFVEAVMSAKENIPVLEVSSESSLETPRYRTATGGESREENAKSSSTSGSKPENSRNSNSADRIGRPEMSQPRDLHEEERIVEREDPRREHDDKVLLHGLIYVAQGKDLSSFNTYLVCRGFWRDDRAASRICTETNNPLYNFHQLIPLVHSQDLLERTRNNCIVIEVYSRKANGNDELLGISKLSVHRLYLAYSDPQVLPQLLSSKYPVISVDEWVSITNPVTGRSCGQIQALVALGTPDQIVLLEMTRGLRDFNVTCDNRGPVDGFSNQTNNPSNTKFTQNQENPTIYERANHNFENYHSNNEVVEDRSLKNISCQTEITTVKYFKQNSTGEELTNENRQSNVLNVIVDRLAQALNAPKSSTDQAAQTEIDFRTRNSNESAKAHEIEPLNLNPSTNNSFSGDSASDADSQRGRFLPSREIYRSVGVGAEFDDPVNPTPSTSYANTNVVSISKEYHSTHSATNVPERKNENPNSLLNRGIPERISTTRLHNPVINECLNSERSDYENSSFRVVVEIECALHLPKVDRIDDTVEPCTYVTFQRARNRNETQYGCYVVTNLYPFSCTPKWDWRCDTRLSNELLENEDKRLILKVWRLMEPETSMEINLERDIVIGFSAIDVSVLTVGFPVVSGWFHVMDFTGKCNGQIKVSVTPLDNIATFGKTTGQLNPARSILPDFDYSNFSSPYPEDLPNNGEIINSERSSNEEIVTNRSQIEHEPVLDIGLNLGDASMSFLSLSLKQKLTELDEIKKRLQTRLHDVTNTAFEDDFENDFDTPVAEDDDANNGNTEDSRNVLRDLENWEQPREPFESRSLMEERGTMTNGNRAHNPEGFERARVTSNSNSASIDANFTDTGYSTSSNVQSCRNVSNGNRYFENDDNRFCSRNSVEEHTINGYDRATMYAGIENLSNGHCPNRAPNALNRTDVLNVRNYRSGDSESLDFRGSSELSRNFEPHNGSTDGSEDHPTRGTRMHINYLLDKLKTQLTAVPPPPTTNQPMKRNIMDLITSLRRDNNNFSNETKCNREVNVRTVPTQTETNYAREIPLTQMSNNSTETRGNLISNERHDSTNDGQTSIKTQSMKHKVSTAVREELAADEGNDTLECDDLSTHLMTTNVRHMDLQSILNPLLYQHVIPDVRTASNGGTEINLQNSSNDSTTPEIEDIVRLDSRYTDNFNSTINSGLSRLRNLMETESASRCAASVTGTSENNEIFRITPSGISENIDGNIDVTVIHKPCNDDLMASNSVDSTTTISLDNDFQNATENDDNSSLNSTETSVSGVSRQAPDGGNPVEESGTSVMSKKQIDSQESSSTS
ncbi:uncharacterized protein [Venturia canescens]|uniref:uncharacterized protein isoform X2 n=1 Tax=Venturia canescens TaxID=32260 RepID=UPI001C9C4D71|nr:uncharacterized protein LOC122416616 isoform X2 [Venturia canescens]